jgi:hypothetical protein
VGGDRLPIPPLLCPSCDYDLAGLPDGVCPECGGTFTRAGILAEVDPRRRWRRRLRLGWLAACWQIGAFVAACTVLPSWTLAAGSILLTDRTVGVLWWVLMGGLWVLRAEVFATSPGAAAAFAGAGGLLACWCIAVVGPTDTGPLYTPGGVLARALVLTAVFAVPAWLATRRAPGRLRAAAGGLVLSYGLAMAVASGLGCSRGHQWSDWPDPRPGQVHRQYPLTTSEATVVGGGLVPVAILILVPWPRRAGRRP